jgi:hypothetical protein
LTPGVLCATIGLKGVPMVRANHAEVEWNAAKKRWEVHIEVGEEVVKRPIPKHTEESGEEALKAQVVATARDEGYELDPANITIEARPAE